MKPTRRFSLVVMLTLGLGITGGLRAQVPDNLSYQGLLTDSAGQTISGPVLVEFLLYEEAIGGAPLWSEAQVITAADGVFTAILGEGALPFPVDLFDGPVFLGIRVEADIEMTPRTPLTSSAFSHRARDADTLSGIDAAQLDQSAAVATLTVDVSDVTQSLATTQTNVTQLQSDVTAAESNIVQLQTELTTTQGDLTAVENTIPTLQSRVAGSCASGSSIRQVFQNGTVACESDDGSEWSQSNDNLYYTTGSIGIGTSAPVAAIQIDAPTGVDPFRARVQSSTKLRVHQNGSVSVGTSSAGPENGLNVSGDAQIGPGVATARMTVTDTLWQTAIDNNDVGGDDWFVGSSATGWAIGGGKYVISPTDSSGNAALVIDSNKDVGIGVSEPSARLHLGGGTDVTPSGGGFLMVGGITGTNIAIDNNEIMARSNGAAGTLSLNAEGGEVRINSGGSRDSDALEIRGRVNFDNGGNSGMRITATNSNPTNALLEPTLFEEALVGSISRPFWRVYSREFYAQTPLQYKTYSDRSLKQNIVKIPAALDTIMALEGVTYELKRHPMDNKKQSRELSEAEKFARDHQLGFIAQDLELVLPQLVTEDKESGLKTVGYMGLIPILVEALKEQQRQIDAQWEEIELLRAQLP